MGFRECVNYTPVGFVFTRCVIHRGVLEKVALEKTKEILVDCKHETSNRKYLFQAISRRRFEVKYITKVLANQCVMHLSTDLLTLLHKILICFRHTLFVYLKHMLLLLSD